MDIDDLVIGIKWLKKKACLFTKFIRVHQKGIKEIVWTVLLLVITVGVVDTSIGIRGLAFENPLQPESVNPVINAEVSPGQLSKAMEEHVKWVCSICDVDEDLAFAYIKVVSNNNPLLVSQVDTSGDGNPDIVRYGLFQIHSDLIAKYEKEFGFQQDLVESAWTNAYIGVKRLSWALDKNETLRGALMAHYYTQPEAQKMWDTGMNTTEIIESIISEYEGRPQ